MLHVIGSLVIKDKSLFSDAFFTLNHTGPSLVRAKRFLGSKSLKLSSVRQRASQAYHDISLQCSEGRGCMDLFALTWVGSVEGYRYFKKVVV